MRCTFALVATVAAVWTAKLDAQEPDYEVYFGNLHSHTSYSDGTGVPEDAYLHARDVAGLDFLAVTEHNHSRAGTGQIAREPELYNGARPDSLIQTALRYTQDGAFVALYGQEFSSISSGNHANILEAGEFISETAVRNGHWDDLLQTWLPAHPDSQGLAPIVLLNHPATSGSRNDVEYGRDDFPDLESWLAAHAANTRLINIINGPSHRIGDPPGRPSESEFRRYLNEGLRVGPTADQDNHQPNWGSAAETRTAVLATSLTRADILDALRHRRVYATQDRNLELYASIAGHIIGSEISDLSAMQAGDPIDITMTVRDPDEPDAEYLVEVFSDIVGGEDDAGVVRRVSQLGDGVVAVDGVTFEGPGQYVYLRVTQVDDTEEGGDRAWTAPVWFGASGIPASTLTFPTAPELELSVDLVAERATIANTGGRDVSVGGFVLRSVQGDQRFTLPANTILPPYGSITIVSGPDAAFPQADALVWTTRNIWRNAGDPGELIDDAGDVVAQTED